MQHPQESRRDFIGEAWRLLHDCSGVVVMDFKVVATNEGQGPALAPAGTNSPPCEEPVVRWGCGRHRPAPRRNGNWKNAQLQAVFIAHDRGCSMSGAAALFDIPKPHSVPIWHGQYCHAKERQHLFLQKQKRSNWYSMYLPCRSWDFN
jgi:hypothetical protein